MRASLLVATLSMSSIGLTGCMGVQRAITLEIPSSSVVRSNKGDIAVRSLVDDRTFENEPPSPSTPSIDGDINHADTKTLKTIIGRRRGEIEQSQSDVQLASGETVETRARALISEGLRRRGYAMAANSASTMDITIRKFWAWSRPGFTGVSFEAEISFDIDLVIGEKRQQFTIHGYGKNEAHMQRDANMKLAYERAFNDFLRHLEWAFAERDL
jgi:hypothetical protein